MSASADFSSFKWAWSVIHTVWICRICVCWHIIFRQGPCNVPLLVFWLQFSNLLIWILSLITGLWGEQHSSTLLDDRVLRLSNKSPSVMIAVSRSRSLYKRLNADITDRLAVYSLSLPTSPNTTANLLRWGYMISLSSMVFYKAVMNYISKAYKYIFNMSQ